MDKYQNEVALWTVIAVVVIGAILIIRYADKIVTALAGG